MDDKGTDFKKMATFFRALGNPTRLKILAELTKNNKCVGEVEHCVQASQASVSQHLAILKEYGIVDCCKQGNMRCYSLRQPELIQAILAAVKKKEYTKNCESCIDDMVFDGNEQKNKTIQGVERLEEGV